MDVVLSDLDNRANVVAVRVSADAAVALGQLAHQERERVSDLFRILEEAGLPVAGNGIAQRLHGDDPLYLMRAPGAPDVRLIVRTGGPDGLPLLVEDVVRPGNLRKVFKAHKA